MARVPGRDNRIAIPVMVLCLGVVGALVWFAIPGMPMVLAWAGGTAGNAATMLAATPTPRAVVADGLDVAATDCRELYPDDLWNELTWTSDAILNQSTGASATAATDLVAALAPTAARTCAWTDSAGQSVVTTFATVADDAAGIAEAALRGQGFACTTTDGTLSCTADTAAGDEHQAVHGALWVTTVAGSWYPEDYDDRIAVHLWQ
ncbi:hypothetical protein [Microbacterium sp. bgisy207]|jgi:hypothetical protein|uniref:hypothetical protein n=1 Tax=Microbacterium sp. bgisy207 TaxID=3413800 RepID=UPI003EBAD2D4